MDSLPQNLPSSPLPTPPGGLGVRPTWERFAFVVLALFFIIFGAIVLDRSAYSDRRRTDAGVFFRAGWAVRAGADPYRVPDENDFYYLYPPGMAVFMAPLADPPPRSPPEPPKRWWAPGSPERAIHQVPGFVPYEVSIVIWYALSIACLIFSIHAISRALELSSPFPEIRTITPRHGGWWNLRFWPLMAVFPDVLSTLSKGQVNLILVACITGAMLAHARSRRFLSGALLALAACIKVIPALLVFEPIARKDWRSLAGVAACALACLFIIPILAFGPARAFDYTHTFVEQVLLAGLGLASAPVLQSGSGPENTDNAAVMGVLHNLTNLSTPRGQRPTHIAPWIKIVHALVAVSGLTATLTLARTRRPAGPILDTILRLAMLSCLLIAASPMVHRHYAVFIYPGIAALVFLSMRFSRFALPTGPALALAIAAPILLALPKLEQQGLLRDLPLPLAVATVTWFLCARALTLPVAHASRPISQPPC